jgi:glycosyltransferase involved in cell wall biosynthesis
MISNTDRDDFDVIEITNEMPHNRIGGVGSVIESLMSGFSTLGVRALWYVVDHQYFPNEVQAILDHHPNVALGSHAELAAFRAPVAHVHSYNHAPGLLDALDGARSLFTVHSLLAYEEISNDVDLHGAVIDQERLIAACDEVALVSEAERGYYRLLGYENLNRRVSVVHNGIALPHYAARRPRRGVLGYCGRLVPRKHPEYVQMLLLEPAFEGFEAMIAGKSFSRYARDLIADLGIERRVHYLGWCGGARLDAFFDAIDVLVQPSVYEPFGLAALEAAARGIPVVCGEVDGLVEVLGEHAFYCDATRYDSFRDAMLRWLHADSECIDAMTEGARRRVLQRFTDVAMADRYVTRFTALAGAAAGPMTEEGPCQPKSTCPPDTSICGGTASASSATTRITTATSSS